MQALITGASGLLGWWVGRELQDKGWTVWGGFRDPPKPKDAGRLWPWGEILPLDLLIPASVEQAVTDATPDLIFHLGALNDIDRCEADPKLARLVNTLGCRWVGKAAATQGARLCYLSTDYVFDGQEAAPYSEISTTNALNAYGQTKKSGEAAIALAHPEPLIIRTTHFGLHPHRPTSLSLLIEQLRSGQSVPMRADIWATPLSSLALAEALVDIGAGPGGTRHLPGQPVSRFDWALAVAAAAKADPNLIQPVGLSAPRPENPLSAGRLSRPEAPQWHGGRGPVESTGTVLPLDTRLRTYHPWTPPTLADDLNRLLTTFASQATP